MIFSAQIFAFSLAFTAAPDRQVLAPSSVNQNSPRVALHTLEPRERKESCRHEITIYPLTAQLNASWTNHFGVAAAYTWHVTERLGIQVSPFFNYISGESGFQRELIDKAGLQADAATALLLRWGGTAGVELVPIDGKFAFGQSVLGHFNIAFTLGIGAASTRVQLSDDGFGNVGAKFIGSVGISAGIALGDQIVLRLEIRDLVTTAKVGKIEGCSGEDFTALAGGKKTSGSCRADGLSELEKNNARLLLETPSSSVLNRLSLMLGVGILF